MWWLHLYVMTSRATCMRNMLILRPPARECLERGPPASLRKALQELTRERCAPGLRRSSSRQSWASCCHPP
eukprot:2762823-Pyramimonas_sp.AAC.1